MLSTTKKIIFHLDIYLVFKYPRETKIHCRRASCRVWAWAAAAAWYGIPGKALAAAAAAVPGKAGVWGRVAYVYGM